MMSNTVSSQTLLEMVGSIVPPLTEDRYKGQCGRIAVIGGCREYTGGPYFAAISALKVGADLSHVFCSVDAAPVIKSYSPELIVHPVLDAPDAEEQLSYWMTRMHGVVVGPGLGQDEKLTGVVKSLLIKVRALDLPLVVDADGLRLVSLEPELLKGYSKAILTPNAMEFQRLQEALLGKSAKNNKEELVVETDDVVQLSQALGNVTVVRKGREDIITDGRNVLVCSAKGSPRRCGGQGDLLCGSLGAFAYWSHLAKKRKISNEILATYGPSLCSSYAACHLTRICAEMAFKESGRSTTTTDLISQIHRAFESLF